MTAWKKSAIFLSSILTFTGVAIPSAWAATSSTSTSTSTTTSTTATTTSTTSGFTSSAVGSTFVGSYTYTVKPGDTLWKISVATGVTISDIAYENSMTNLNMLYVGQTLIIPGPSEIKANHIVQTAEKYLGSPYLWGGVSPSGFDCSGFVEYVFLQNGMTLPRNSAQQYAVGTSVDTSSLRKGDLVFFGDTYRTGISHDGIYIGNGQFIHAASEGVIISSLSNVYWAAHYVGAKRDIAP